MWCWRWSHGTPTTCSPVFWQMYKLYGISLGGHLQPWIMVMAAWTINMGPNSHENLQTRPLSKSIICKGMTCMRGMMLVLVLPTAAAIINCYAWSRYSMITHPTAALWDFRQTLSLKSLLIIFKYITTLTSPKTGRFEICSLKALPIRHQIPKVKVPRLLRTNSRCALLMMVVVCSQSGYHHIHT